MIFSNIRNLLAALSEVDGAGFTVIGVSIARPARDTEPASTDQTSTGTLFEWPPVDDEITLYLRVHQGDDNYLWLRITDGRVSWRATARVWLDTLRVVATHGQ